MFKFTTVSGAPAPALPSLPTARVSSLSPVLDPLLGGPALLRGEDAEGYAAFYAAVREHTKPADVIEEILVRDFVQRAWDVERLRRCKTQLLADNALNALRSALEPAVEDYQKRTRLVCRWAKGEGAASRRVADLLAQAGLDLDAVAARTLANNLGRFEKIEHLLQSAESRRDALLREISRRRETLARQLAAAPDIESADFRELDPSNAA